MSSRVGSKSFASQSSKGKNVSEGSNPKVDQLSQGVAGVNLDASQDDTGDWEVIARKNKNRPGNAGGKSWAHQNSNPRAWGGRGSDVYGRGTANAWAKQGTDSRGNIRPQMMGRGYVAPQAVIQPPLENGWNWQSRASSTLSRAANYELGEEDVPDEEKSNDGGDDYGSDALDDSDEDLCSDEYDSDASQKSHETRKQGKWFKKFFDIFDKLSVDEINEPQRQWHCPACQGGPGAIDWYCLQPLMTHARTKGSRRVKLHRELAELLEEELRRRGTSAFPAGEAFGQWKGLDEEEKDYEIVWPPMVMVMNTRLDKDENDKWLGMGNQELLDYFGAYAASKARHSYGPQGHRGMSVLIFENSANGFIEAERLHRHFVEQGTDRNAWERRRGWYHGGIRQLYGFIASKEDLEIFNQHSPGKSRLKFEMKSYREMVVKQLRQIAEENQLLNWYKNKVAIKDRREKALKESLGIMSEKLRKTTEENRIVKQRTKMQYEQNRQERDSQDKFFEEQLKVVYDARGAKEENFELLQQQERAKVKQQNADLSSTDEFRKRAEYISKFVECQEKEMEEFVGERERLIKEHEKKIVELKRRYQEEQLELERDFDESLNQLMEKYAPQGADPATAGDL